MHDAFGHAFVLVIICSSVCIFLNYLNLFVSIMGTKINLLIIFISCLFYIVCASADGSSFDYRIIIYLRRWCIVSIYSDILYVIVHSHSCFCLSFCKYQYVYMLATPLFLLMFL
jgi:hypothetical protein